MARIRIIVLAILAVFSVSVVAAASALGTEGELVNKNGAALTKTKFKGTSGPTILQQVSPPGASIKCELDTVEGIVTSKTTAEETVNFTKCKNSVGTSCKSEGQANGTIQILVSLRLLRNKATKEILWSVSILSSRYTGGIFNINCSGLILKVKGAFNVPVGASTLKQLYVIKAEQTAGKQKVAEFENEAKEKINNTLESELVEGEGFKQSAEEGTEDINFEETVEFK